MIKKPVECASKLLNNITYLHEHPEIESLVGIIGIIVGASVSSSGIILYIDSLKRG